MSPDTINYLGQFGPLVLMMALLYFLFIRPQKREQEKRQNMLAALKKGDRVITLGGMHGKIVDINEKDILLQVADQVEIRFVRAAVQTVQTEEN